MSASTHSPAPSATSSSPPQTTTLLTLPAHLRLEIYNQAFTAEGPIQVVPRDGPWLPPICQVCHTIRQEAFPLFLQQKTFRVEIVFPDEDCRETIRETIEWLNNLGSTRISALAHLEIRQDFARECKEWPWLDPPSQDGRVCIRGFVVTLDKMREQDPTAQQSCVVTVRECPEGHACDFSKAALPHLSNEVVRLLSSVKVRIGAGAVALEWYCRVVESVVRMVDIVADAHDDMCESMREDNRARGFFDEFYDNDERLRRTRRITTNSLKGMNAELGEEVKSFTAKYRAESRKR